MKIFKYIISIIKLITLKIKYFKRLDLKLSFLKNELSYIDSGTKILIKGNSKVVLKKFLYLSRNTKLECINGLLSIGQNCFFNTNCNIIALENITIGDNCIFGSNIGIYDHNHRFSSKSILIREQGFDTKPIYIGSDVWIGSNATITSGVKIGNRVVVAANSVVNKDLESNGLYAGVPAKLIKKI